MRTNFINHCISLALSDFGKSPLFKIITDKSGTIFADQNEPREQEITQRSISDIRHPPPPLELGRTETCIQYHYTIAR